MSDAIPGRQRKVLAFSAIVEVGTGLALTIDPALVVALLIGADLPGAGAVLGRCFGITLVALSLACWPGRQRVGNAAPAVRGMLLYNALIALYLAYLGTLAHFAGPMLWPAVALHAVVALLLVWTARDRHRIDAAGQ